MSINYHGNWRSLECDECGEELEEFEKDDFDVMIADAKAKDWTINNDCGTWHHFCPSCVLGQGNKVDNARALFGLPAGRGRPKISR